MGDVVNLGSEFARRQQSNKSPRHNVNFLIFDAVGDVLLFHRFDKKSLAASGQNDPNHPSVEKWWDIPGGRVDYPENNLRAVTRENLEELDIIVSAILSLSVMENPTPNCRPGSTRSIYVVTDYAGEPSNKAGLAEGHLGMYAVAPAEAVELLGDKIDDETRHFLKVMAPDFFRVFCHQNRGSQIQAAPGVSI